MAKIAFLGAGLIGHGLAEAAAKRGDTVVAWNRTLAKAKSLEQFGVRVAESAVAAVADVERVHIALSDDAAVDAVLASLEGKLGPGIYIDHTTTSPAGTAARANTLAKAGTAFVHAPVFMSPAMCREAKGIILAAADETTFATVKAPLEAMTGKVVYLGAEMTRAAAQKLFGNAMLITITAGLSDVFLMGKTLGMDPGDALSLFKLFNPGVLIQSRGPKMADGDYTASFELTMARKDVRLMIEAAGENDASLAVLPAIAKRMDQLIERGFGADDMAVLSVDAIPKTNS